MHLNPGGCLCGAIRDQTAGAPARVTICHRNFCQRAAGAPFEPHFHQTPRLIGRP